MGTLLDADDAGVAEGDFALQHQNRLELGLN